ncbi:MAG: AmmeMemoRadiSam system radical SAM enzyme [Candidatus Bathyarchaeia archaeon]
METLSGQLQDLLERPNVREASLFTVEGGATRCLTCERRCIISLGKVGYCRTRINIEGRLYTLIYGDISSISINPIEKKPLFHFWPGSKALTFGSWSCNFPCPWCQNSELSKRPPNPQKAEYISPQDLLKMPKTRFQGTSISFNEPTLTLEYALDLFPLAKKMGLYNTYVSNGYMTTSALRKLRDAGLDAVKFDVKGSSESVRKYCEADVGLVWRNVKSSISMGMHVEIVTLLIPRINDDVEAVTEIVREHLRYAGPETPLHFSRFYPSYMMMDWEATPIESLEKAYSIAKREGVEYVYLGNCPGHKYENTYCPRCGELLIERYLFDIVDYRLSAENSCPACGEDIPITGRFVT